VSETQEHAVMMLVSRRVKPGSEAAYEQVCQHMMAAASRFDGYLGAQLVHPGEEPDVEDPLFHVILAFDSAVHLARWQQSPERQLGIAATVPHVEGGTQIRHISGLAHWFKPPGSSSLRPPPKWKVAVVTWLGICPTVYLVFSLLDPLLANWSLLPRVVLLTLLVVAAMTWLVAPQLTRFFKRWLYTTP
jgi:antibiotic biosynthesis monooxygenase (ABM) superfamily enzyme